MKARMLLVVLLVFVALVLVGCEELGIDGALTPAAPGVGTLEATPPDGLPDVTPDVDETPLEGVTPDLDVTPDTDATPGVDLTPDADATPDADMTPDADATPGVDETPVAAEAPETLDIATLNMLDDQFDTYVVSTVVTFTADVEGEVGFLVHTEVMTREGGFLGLGTETARRSVITVTQDGEEVGAMEFVTAGEDTWILQNGQWIETDVAPEDLLDQIGWVGNAEDLISDDAEGEFVGEETVNDIPTWHYRYGTEAFTDTERLEDLENAEADVWVSQEHQVAVRMVVRAVGRGPEEEMGTLEIESNLVSFDEPVEFDLPPALDEDVEATPDAKGTPAANGTPEATGTPAVQAAAGPTLLVQRGIPWLDDATNIREGPNVVVYMTEATPEDVISFYQQSLAETDWEIEDDQMVGTTARFMRQGEAVNVFAIGGEAGNQTTVIVSAGDE
ncbi:MAG: hypothetical protein ACYC5M_14965 [Anaerolineae bacterium]